MQVDPWGGFNRGLAALNEGLDTSYQNLRQEDQDRRRNALTDLQTEGMTLENDEKRRKISDLRAYDAAKKNLEANPGTVPTMTEQSNPAYIPAGNMTGLSSIKDRIRQGPTRMVDVGEGPPAEVPNTGMLPTAPAQGLPTMGVAGTRAPNPAEMASRRIELAVQHGQYADIAQIGTIMDVTDKIAGHQQAQVAKAVASAKANRLIMGPQAALELFKRDSLAMGIPPDIVNAYKMNADGIIYRPDGMGGVIVVVETPDGKFEVKHIEAKEPKAPTEAGLYERAAQGDPVAAQAIKDIQAGKIRVAQESKPQGGGFGGPYVPNTPTGIPGQRNEEVLKGLSAGEAATVKGLVDYKVAPLQGFVLKSDWGQKIIGAAQMYDPSFDYTQYVSRQKLKNDFTSGKVAANIRSLNTAISHMDTLKKKGEALQNSWSPTWNRVANVAYTAAGDPRVQGWDTALNAVAGELATVFKNTSGTDQEIKSWKENSHNFNSPKQIDETINTATELLGGRLQAISNQWETGMGRPKDFHFLSDKSRTILKSLGTNPDAWDPVASKSSAAPTATGAPGRAAPAAGVSRVRVWNPVTNRLEDAK